MYTMPLGRYIGFVLGAVSQRLLGFLWSGGFTFPWGRGRIAAVPFDLTLRRAPEGNGYYCDNIEVGRHVTLPMCKQRPLFALANLATGGGWPVDLSRYGNVDMYVDFVRIYQGKK